MANFFESFDNKHRDTEVPLSVVEEFDPEKYLGVWYEIARYTSWFEHDLEAVTAEYSLRDDGKIDVKNTGHKKEVDGKEKVAIGDAEIVGHARLNVTFTPKLNAFMSKFTKDDDKEVEGDYWVLGLKKYEVAVVGNPRGHTGWILAREPKISDEDLEWGKSILVKNGYDLEGLKMVEQVEK